jgi:hypothetical protein
LFLDDLIEDAFSLAGGALVPLEVADPEDELGDGGGARISTTCR